MKLFVLQLTLTFLAPLYAFGDVSLDGTWALKGCQCSEGKPIPQADCDVNHDVLLTIHMKNISSGTYRWSWIVGDSDHPGCQASYGGLLTVTDALIEFGASAAGCSGSGSSEGVPPSQSEYLLSADKLIFAEEDSSCPAGQKFWKVMERN